jgi:small subunit ribosomal protein S20
LANKKSAAKRHRQSIGRRMRNRIAKSTVKTAVRKFLNAIEAKDKAIAESEFKNVQKVLDTTAGKGILHKNMVARKKSRLASRLKALA